METKAGQTDLKFRSRAARTAPMSKHATSISIRNGNFSPNRYDSFSRHEQTGAVRINGTALGLHLQDYASTLLLPFG